MFRRPAIFRRKNDLFIYDSSLLNNNQVVKDEAPKTGVFEILFEFCGKSSIHGLIYLNDRKRSLIERVWWATAVALSFSLCGYWAFGTWLHRGTDRLILRSSKSSITVDTIPFPAVTICPINKVAAKKFNYTDIYRALMKADGENSRNVSSEECEMMKIVSQLCEFRKSTNVSQLFPELYAKRSIYDIMMKAAPDMNETFARCRLFDKRIDCSEIFSPTLSDAGFCFSFNVVKLSEHLTDDVYFNVSEARSQKRVSNWTIDDGYKIVDKTQELYPYRVIDAGIQNSLIVTLKINNNDIDYLCGGTIQGFKVGFHSPIDIPRMKTNFFDLSPNTAAFYSIDPRSVTTSRKVREFSADKRSCYLNSERKLRFYRQYTRNNCLAECLSNYTFSQCGCVHFSMMHTNDTNVCGIAKMSCWRGAEKYFHRTEDFEKCNCLPSCSVIFYDAYPTTTNFDFTHTVLQKSHYKDINLENASFSRLIVSFKSEAFIPIERIENYDWVDILSYIGGFCGLFMGISLLSIIEFLYYFTLRAYFKYRNKQNSNKSHKVFPYLP